jgi:hypothetical protein
MKKEMRKSGYGSTAVVLLVLCWTPQTTELIAAASVESESDTRETILLEPDLATPVRLEADGEPIDLGKLSSHAHAGPWLADVDEDGDRDLLVGDFPGYFWFFENIGSDSRPKFTAQGKLQAGDTAAKTPVY